MINAVGLQNPGIDVFIERDIPFLQKFDTKIIVNVCGNSVSDYLQVVERLSETVVDMLKSIFHARMLNMVALHLGKSQRWWNTLPVK